MDTADQWREFLVTERRTGQRDSRSGADRDIERRISDLVDETRRKIEEDPRAPIYLQTVRGVGYVLMTD